jgi:pimeloyl-ACP methyl ester carboxylesterase
VTAAVEHRRAAALVLALALAVGLGASPVSASESVSRSRPAPTYRGPVRLENDRTVYLHCEGTGSPTIVLESGYHDNAQLWSEAEPTPPASGPAVLPGLARTNRVCAYDRPGTLDYSKQPPTITTRSSSVTMPRSAADVVHDLHATLAKARIRGPFVLVAHSLGGLFALLYARTYPAQIRGMVLVDAFSPTVPALFGENWPAYRSVLSKPGTPEDDKPGFEVIDVDRSVAELNEQPPLPAGLPLVVISKTEPFPLPPDVSGFTPAQLEQVWTQAQNQLTALEPHTPHVIATGSDHYVQVRQPDVVIAATRLVIHRAVPKDGTSR